MSPGERWRRRGTPEGLTAETLPGIGVRAMVGGQGEARARSERVGGGGPGMVMARGCRHGSSGSRLPSEDHGDPRLVLTTTVLDTLGLMAGVKRGDGPLLGESSGGYVPSLPELSHNASCCRGKGSHHPYHYHQWKFIVLIPLHEMLSAHSKGCLSVFHLVMSDVWMMLSSD